MPYFQYFAVLKALINILKEIIVSLRITSLDNSIRFITPQDFGSGVFLHINSYYRKAQKTQKVGIDISETLCYNIYVAVPKYKYFLKSGNRV